MIAAKILGGIVAVIIVAALGEAYLKRNKHRSLSSRLAERTADDVKPELGLEATDTKSVDEAHRRNKKIDQFNDRLSKRL
ncbi:hypothetical protein MWU53_02300 [Aliiroseovarius sp. S1123]|uniref:hypothetical protein n=1 Tax=unclassified Aliiroseovarius TaxID=2623558 RepID=UPI001FF13E34|nr:hypothetical protein [Aliiroseovarius sp. S1123]MCK0169881.1 hypothetical protein [Aliiroseovarius sp. S1123]